MRHEPVVTRTEYATMLREQGYAIALPCPEQQKPNWLPTPFVLAEQVICLDSVIGAPGYEFRDLLELV